MPANRHENWSPHQDFLEIRCKPYLTREEEAEQTAKADVAVPQLSIPVPQLMIPVPGSTVDGVRTAAAGSATERTKMPSPMASSRLSGRTGALTARSSGGLTARSELKPQTIGNAILTPRGQKDTDERGDRTRAAKDAPPSARSRGRGQARGSEDESVPADVPSKVVTV